MSMKSWKLVWFPLFYVNSDVFRVAYNWIELYFYFSLESGTSWNMMLQSYKRLDRLVVAFCDVLVAFEYGSGGDSSEVGVWFGNGDSGGWGGDEKDKEPVRLLQWEKLVVVDKCGQIGISIAGIID